jgi:hypothetical protein
MKLLADLTVVATPASKKAKIRKIIPYDPFLTRW